LPRSMRWPTSFLNTVIPPPVDFALLIVNRGKNHIAVTGMGGCSAAGGTVAEILASLEKGSVHCRPVPENIFRTSLSFPAFAFAHAIPSLRSRRLLDQSGIAWTPERLNRTLLLTLEALAEALEDAGLEPEKLRSTKVGIALGTTVGCTFHDEQYYISWRDGKKPDPDPVFQYLESNLAAFLQTILGVIGPVSVVTNACASGTDAIGIARGWLEDGTCDIAFAGGADALSRIAYYGFASLMLLSEKPCSPFDRGRAGLNLGEGAALLVMEKRQQADRRNARPHGWVRGYGAASDCYHPTAPHPDGRGLQSALRQAMADAGISPRTISYINAHGTGTSANDNAEMNALAALGFSECPVVSTKGITGHMLGAAGAMEAILTILTLKQKQTRGTVSCREPDPCLARPPLAESQEVRLPGSIGISQSLAFGGTNSALVLEAATP